MWQVINTDATRVYVEEDLLDTAILERALRQLYLCRLGRSQDLVLGTIHVEYDALTNEQAKAALQRKVKLTERHLRLSLLTLTSISLLGTTGKFLPCTDIRPEPVTDCKAVLMSLTKTTKTSMTRMVRSTRVEKGTKRLPKRTRV